MNAQDLDWNDLRFVLAVLRCGTLSGAARVLGVNHSTVFRRIRGIETRAGVRLFDRLPTGYAATTAGEAVREVAERIESEVLELSRALTGGDLRLSGVLRIAGPDALTLRLIVPLLAEFRIAYPAIELEVVTANRFADLSRREADVVIRSTVRPPESAVGRRLCALATTFYATPNYLAKHPAAAMAEHSYLLPDDTFEHYPPAQWLRTVHANCSVALRSNTLQVLHEAAALGMGVAPLPCFLGDADARLERVLAPQAEFEGEIWLLTHADLQRTARVRALMDFLAQAMVALKPRLEGHAHRAATSSQVR